MVGGSPLLRPAAPMAAGKPRKKETYMSKNLTRKGFALAAVVALGSTLFAGAPATANSSGPLTLLPNGGTATGATYTSLIGAGLTLTSELDADKQAPATTRTGTVTSGEEVGQTVSINVPAVDPLARSYYIIENAAEAEIKLTLTGNSITDNYYEFDVNGDPVIQTGDTVNTDFTSAVGGNSFITDAAKIVVMAGVGGTAGDRDVAPLTIDANDADGTDTIKVKVTSFADTVNGTDDTTAKINNGEWKSATQEVTLIPAAGVSVTTTMHSSTVRGAAGLNARIAFGSSVNPHAVVASGALAGVFYEDGVTVNVNQDGTTDVVSGSQEYKTATVSATTGVISVAATRTANLPSAVYSARAVFRATTPDIFIGARSVVLDLRDGTNALVTGADAKFTETNDLAISSSNALVRAGTKAVPVVGQALRSSNTTALAAAGVRVRATVTGVTVDATSEITVTGSTTKIVEAGDSITVFGFTDAKGQFPLTINSTTGKNLDQVNVQFAALDSNGLFVTTGGNTRSVTWQTAALQSTLKVSPNEFLTGETVNVTFTAVDQFGVGIDQNATGRISIRVDAYVNGAVKSSTYSETKPTTAGAAAFSFKNFATAGSNQEIRVQVLQGSSTFSTAYYTVYNNIATSGFAIADSFSTRVVYNDFVVGKLTDAAVSKAATDAGIVALAGGAAGTDYALIVGTALDANNAGQPGAAVTISAAGVLFYDAQTSTLAKDSITVFANGQGFFDVQAMAQKVNAKGQTVTITAGGKTATTLLRTFLPTSIDAKNLKFNWTLPANLVKNTTYSVALTLTDVWGNPLQTLKTNTNNGGTAVNLDALTVSADGSLQVNGVAQVVRNFNATGTATVFVRSVTDVAGPGQLRAAVGSLNYLTGGASSEIGRVNTTATVYTDTVTTSWNEASWSDALAVDVDVLDRAATTGTVNVGSFNGKLVVYASGLDGARISWKVGGNWGSAVAVGNTLNRFDRPTPRAGVTVSVEIYVNGVKQLTKSVVTR